MTPTCSGVVRRVEKLTVINPVESGDGFPRFAVANEVDDPAGYTVSE
jgi:hypothetical protein